MTQTCYMVVASGGEYEDSYSHTIEVSLDQTVAELRVVELNERHAKLTSLVQEVSKRFQTWLQNNRRPDYRDYPRTSPPKYTQKAMRADAKLKREYDECVAINVKANDAWQADLVVWFAKWYPDYVKICERHGIDPLPNTQENNYKIQGNGFDDTTEYSVEEAPLIG